MILKLCARCQKLIEAPNTYCDKCKDAISNLIEQRKQQSNNKYNRNRATKYTKFYNSKEWRMLSKSYLTRHSICEECEKEAQLVDKYNIQIAEEVHHREPIQTEAGWIRRLDWNNLIALCHRHHDIKHERFKRKKS